MRRALWASGLLACALLVGGCKDEDGRNTEEKMFSPAPDFATRHVMPCPKCGAPQKPCRITSVKSHYRCSGQPPKFPYHQERLWSHRISHDKKSVEQ